MTAGAVPTASGAEPVLVRLRQPEEVRVPALAATPREFHATMPGYDVTALRRAPATARRLNIAEVLVKDESARLGLPSFKVLGASWAVYRALLERLGATPEQVPSFDALARAVEPIRPLALSAATDGNHGRAVAHIARMLGLGARIYVPRGTAAARIEAIAGEGAEVTVVDGGYSDAVKRSAEDAGERCLVISDTSWEGYEEVPRWVIEGYSTIFSEIAERLAAEGARWPEIVVVPVGVGALAAAAVAYFWSLPAGRPRIVAVEPVSAACVLESMIAGHITTLGHEQDSLMAGLNCDAPSLVAWPLVSQGIDVYLTVHDTRVPEAMRLLAEDGITAGETGAAGLAGLLRIQDGGVDELQEALEVGPDSRALLLCTEGATDPATYEQLVGRAGTR